MLPLRHLLAGMVGALYGAIPSTHAAACRVGQRLLEPSSPPFRGDLGAAVPTLFGSNGHIVKGVCDIHDEELCW